MTQLTSAIEGIITIEMEQVAAIEGVPPEFIKQGIEKGTIVIPNNKLSLKKVVTGIGAGLSTKVCASIGLYGESNIEDEMLKIKAAVEAGANCIFDFTASGDFDNMRRRTMMESPIPVGTLPLYQALAEAAKKYNTSSKMTVEDLFEIIERQAKDGVDLMALHCGMTLNIVQQAKQLERVDPLHSYSAAHLMGWMLHNKCENPLYEHFHRILEIARKYDITICIADGMQPGCLVDSLDDLREQELVIIGDLVKQARRAGVQVIVQGPGHLPLNKIQSTIELQKRLCHDAPYYVLGPLVTDSAIGYNHISGSIGAAMSAWAGSEMICVVTASDRLGIPNIDELREGVIATRIAAHAADLARGNKLAWKRDRDMAQARIALNVDKQINLAIDPIKVQSKLTYDQEKHCETCGAECSAQVAARYFDFIV